MNKVLVVGSINTDFVVSADRFPQPGETISGTGFATFSGGKGANQAVAAQRLGAQVTLLGCVGNDAHGAELIRQLKAEGIDTGQIRIVGDTHTGMAAITVSQGENCIIVVPGANHALLPAHVAAAEEQFALTDVVLCQLEIPMDTVEAAAQMAARHGKPFLLNPAPAVPLSRNLIANTTLLTPNEHELLVSLDCPSESWQTLLSRYPERIVMTCGAEGACYADAQGQIQRQPSFKADVVDTTGAGDTFNGALAAFWGKDSGLPLRHACAAASLSVTKKGAQGGMPTLAELNAFLAAGS